MEKHYLSGNVGKTTDTRITLTDSEGNVLYDNEAEASKASKPQQPSGICPGYGRMDREKSFVIRKPCRTQTFYYAVKLNDGRILRLAKTTDSVFHTLLSSFIWLGLLMLVNHSGRDRAGTKTDKESD